MLKEVNNLPLYYIKIFSTYYFSRPEFILNKHSKINRTKELSLLGVGVDFI